MTPQIGYRVAVGDVVIIGNDPLYLYLVLVLTPKNRAKTVISVLQPPEVNTLDYPLGKKYTCAAFDAGYFCEFHSKSSALERAIYGV